MSVPQSLADFDLPLDQLERYCPKRDEPEGFDRFWESSLAEAANHPLDLQLDRTAERLRSLHAFTATFRGFAGDPIRALVLLDPDLPGPRPCVVQFLGYHAGLGTAYDRLSWAVAGYVQVIVETRGEGNAWNVTGTPDPHRAEPQVPGQMTKGIRAPESYFYRRVFVDAARAVQAAAALPDVDPERIAVTGRSQGGGIALAAGALADVAAVVADVPFLCHFGRAIRLTDEQPFSEIANYLRIYRDEADSVMRTLSYFDGMNFAARGTAPALFSAGLMDRICPPSTVFAAYNHYAGPRQMEVWPFNGHESGEHFQLEAEHRFLDALLRP